MSRRLGGPSAASRPGPGLSARMTSKAGVVLLALLGAGVALASGGRVWVRGTVDDAVLGASQIEGAGSEVASGVIVLALTAGAAALVTATSGRVTRRVTLGVLLLATLGLGSFVVRVLVDPSGSLGAVAARATGRSGSIQTAASATAWPWLALVAVIVLLASWVAGLLGARRWAGLSSRYETPGQTPGQTAGQGAGQTAGSRGERVGSDWERLTAGEDPTEESADRPT